MLAAQDSELRNQRNRLERCHVEGCSFQGTKWMMIHHTKKDIHQVGGEDNLGGFSSRKFETSSGPVSIEFCVQAICFIFKLLPSIRI